MLDDPLCPVSMRRHRNMQNRLRTSEFSQIRPV
jgi:hypothetical protein